MNDLAVFAMWPKARRIVGAPNRPEAEHLLVERDRPLEIGDLQSHSTEMSRFRESVFGGAYPALGIGRRCSAHVNLRATCNLRQMLRLGAFRFVAVAGPERLDGGEQEKNDEYPLRDERLHARIDAERFDVGA